MADFLAFVKCAGCGELFQVRSKQALARAKWCSERCRKRQYGQPCIDCGKRTTHGAEHARLEEPRCYPCSMAKRTTWTQDAIIEAIGRWHALYGEPPACPDWNPTIARGDEDRALRLENGQWPSVTHVFHVFGSWNAAIGAAGFQPRVPHGGGGNVKRRRPSGSGLRSLPHSPGHERLMRLAVHQPVALARQQEFKFGAVRDASASIAKGA
jgi:hypothetical protein